MQETNNNTIWSVITTIIITALVMGTAGAWMYIAQNNRINDLQVKISQLENENKDLQDKINGSKTVNQQLSEGDSNSEWKIYTSKELGISFSYPADWNILDSVIINTTSMVLVSPLSLSHLRTVADDSNNILTVEDENAQNILFFSYSYVSKDKLLLVQQKLNELKSKQGSEQEIRDMTVDNSKGFISSIASNIDSNAKILNNVLVFPYKDKTGALMIESGTKFTKENQNTEITKAFEKIVESIKFVE